MLRFSVSLRLASTMCFQTLFLNHIVVFGLYNYVKPLLYMHPTLCVPPHFKYNVLVKRFPASLYPVLCLIPPLIVPLTPCDSPSLRGSLNSAVFILFITTVWPMPPHVPNDVSLFVTLSRPRLSKAKAFPSSIRLRHCVLFSPQCSPISAAFFCRTVVPNRQVPFQYIPFPAPIGPLRYISAFIGTDV